jgi:hypothetical protein
MCAHQAWSCADAAQEREKGRWGRAGAQVKLIVLMQCGWDPRSFFSIPNKICLHDFMLAWLYPSQIRYACMTLVQALLSQFIARLFDDLLALAQLTRIAIVDDQKCKPKKCTQEWVFTHSTWIHMYTRMCLYVYDIIYVCVCTYIIYIIILYTIT